MYAHVYRDSNSVLLTKLKKINWKAWVDTLELDTVYTYPNNNGEIIAIELSDFNRYLDVGNVDMPYTGEMQIQKPRDLLEKYEDMVICDTYLIDKDRPLLTITFKNLDQDRYLVNLDKEDKYVRLEDEIFAKISDHGLKEIVITLSDKSHMRIINEAKMKTQ